MEASSTHGSAAPADRSRPEIDVVGKIQSILTDQHSPLADKFSTMKYVQQAQGQSEAVQRHLVNRQLRMHLGEMEKDTSIARLALDDNCNWNEYLKNFKRYVVPEL